MPQNAFFQRTHNLLFSQKMTQTLFSTLHSISIVIVATAAVLAFVLLRNSRFSFHCYTQCEATPTQKLARKCTATSHDFLRKRLQNAFTLANQLRWIAQYSDDLSRKTYVQHSVHKSLYHLQNGDDFSIIPIIMLMKHCTFRMATISPNAIYICT